MTSIARALESPAIFCQKTTHLRIAKFRQLDNTTHNLPYSKPRVMSVVKNCECTNKLACYTIDFLDVLAHSAD